MNAEALLKVAEVVVVPPVVPGYGPRERFSLDAWFRRPLDADGDPEGCGYVACAVGTAAAHPWFAERGFGLGYGFAVCDRDDDFRLMSEVRAPYVVGVGSDWEAVERFFDLSEDEAEYLFAAWRYPLSERTPGHVADRIGRFVASGGTVADGFSVGGVEW